LKNNATPIDDLICR